MTNFMIIDKDLTPPQISSHLSFLKEAKEKGINGSWPWTIDEEITAFEQRLNELQEA